MFSLSLGASVSSRVDFKQIAAECVLQVHENRLLVGFGGGGLELVPMATSVLSPSQKQYSVQARLLAGIVAKFFPREISTNYGGGRFLL